MKIYPIKRRDNKSITILNKLINLNPKAEIFLILKNSKADNINNINPMIRVKG